MRTPLSWLAGLVVGACLASAAAANEKIAVGYSPGLLTYLAYDVARYQKLFEKEGLDVTFVNVASSKAAQALLAGSLDFSGNSADHAIKARAQGQPLVVVAGLTIASSWVVVVNSRLKDQVKTLHDLKGRTVGVTLLGSGSHLTLRYLLKKDGIAEEALNIVPLSAGLTAVLAALKNEKVEAAMSFEPLSSLLLPSKDFYALVDLRKRADRERYFGKGDFAYTVVLTRPDVVRGRPQVVQKVVNAIAHANRWIAGHSPAEIAALYPPDAIKDRATFVASLGNMKEVQNPDGRVSLESLDNAIEFHRLLGTLKKEETVTAKDLLDARFVDRALGGR